jgi:2-polyprenyl-6-methoxyphenol hydroxylase-like FAD-dependent oxidoreductase
MKSSNFSLPSLLVQSSRRFLSSPTFLYANTSSSLLSKSSFFRDFSTSIMSANTRKPILISGAGLASLLLGQSLRRANIPFLIFERDSGLSFRAQGYRLRLSSEGLDAIESALGPEAWQKFWDTCGKTGGSGFAIIDALTGEKISEPPKESVHEKTEEEPKPKPRALTSRDGKVVGISRGDMRKLFMSGCEEFVNWSHHVTSYELTSSGVRVIFADGSKSVEGEMLIGGEGIYSKVAKQLSGGKLKVYDTGARGIHGQAPTTAFKDLGEGVWMIRDNSNPKGKAFVITNVRSGDMDDPNVQFGWTMGAVPGVIRAPNDDFSLIGTPAAEIAKALTANWHPRLKPLFEEMAVSEAAFWKITCSTPTDESVLLTNIPPFLIFQQFWVSYFQTADIFDLQAQALRHSNIKP